MNDIMRELSLIGIVPVIKIEDPGNAVPLAGALIRGGLPCAEVTFRTGAAKEAIARITASCPEMLVGAGTVLTPAQADDAVEAGARFIVSPGFNPDVVRHCIDIEVPVVPGINNPSGIEQALSMGLDTVKFFPAEQSGGIKMIKAMSAPYGAVRFMPTGGINPSNICDYLAFDKILCCGGSWMVDAKLISAGDFDGIEKLVRGAVDTMLGLKFRHIGINSENEEEAARAAATLGAFFGFPSEERTKSYFLGTEIEVMKSAGRGRLGHVGIYTNSVDRAVYHLERRGVRFDMQSATYDQKGAMKFIYLQDEINGFAFHLVN